MIRINAIIACLLCTLAILAQTDYTSGQAIWFDQPTTLDGRAVWYGGRPDLWQGKGMPEWAGEGAYNPDQEWESKSLPIGNGSIGANIMGSLEAERITFNEKTLWRGGPNTAGGAEYYWNVNKKSAHLHDGNHAYKLFGNLLKNGTLDNLWDTHAPFQIDGNFGGTAGITEMLMQSHMGFIHLLPALPDAWEEGNIKGLCAKGGFDVDITWKDGKLTEAVITSKSGERCNLRYGNETRSFGTKRGKSYKIVLKNGKLKTESRA